MQEKRKERESLTIIRRIPQIERDAIGATRSAHIIGKAEAKLAAALNEWNTVQIRDVHLRYTIID